MATLTKGYTFGSTELVTNEKLHDLIDDATITGIVAAEITSGTITNTQISASAAIADTKLAQLTTSDKVAWSALLAPTFYENTLVSYENEIVYY